MSALQLFRSIHQILSASQRRRFVRYQAFFVLSGAFQLIGAGSVAPFVGLLSDPDLLRRNALASSATRLLGLQSDLQAMIAFAVLMIILLVVSNALAAVGVWLTYRFSLGVGADVKDDLLRCYLRRDYVYISGVNSSDLINKIGVGAPRFAFNVLLPLMNIASSGALLLVVLVGLALYQPSVLFIFGTIIGGGYLTLFLVVRRKLVKLGDFTWKSSQRIHRLLIESLGGLKEIRLAGTEERYRTEHLSTTKETFRAESIIGMLGDVPRFLLESVAFSALLVLAIAMLTRGTETSVVVSTLTLYAVAGYRMLPAGQTIYKSVSQVRSNMPVIAELLPDILEGRSRKHATNSTEVVPNVPDVVSDIVLRDVWFSYPNSPEPVLKGITATIPANRLTVVVGQSGSGKSTMSDLLLGLLSPSRGTLEVGDVSIQSYGRGWFEVVGYVPQTIFLLDDSIAENIAFGSPLGIDKDRLTIAIDRARLRELVESIPEGESYRVGERGSRLSGGQRQRVGLARALYHDARYLILDEATSALDGSTEAEVIETLLDLRRERTVVMIAHRTSTIMAADHIIMLENGIVVAEGDVSSLLETSGHFRRLIRHAGHTDHHSVDQLG